MHGMNPKMAALFQKLVDNTCSPEEFDTLIMWLDSEEGRAASAGLIQEHLEAVSVQKAEDPALRQRLRQRLGAILSETAPPVTQARSRAMSGRRKWLAAAAALALFLALGAALWSGLRRPPDATARPLAREAILPGSDRAVLTLDNDSSIVLDKSGGQALCQGSTQLLRTQGGGLVYQPAAENRRRGGGRHRTGYNTLSTPKGGQYRITLADGTRVWLNAGSSLRYPVAFYGKTRQVWLSGEAYFEVAPRPEQPFIVEAGKEKIYVLGTSFNVRAYAGGEHIQTTLAEGLVKVAAGKTDLVLKPGSQASMDPATGRLQVSAVDVEGALAWKDGMFHFNGTNIRTIMQDVARWYDVDVQYMTGDLDSKNFSGVISRYSQVTELLKRLEMTGLVHFTVKDRVIIVRD